MDADYHGVLRRCRRYVRQRAGLGQRRGWEEEKQSFRQHMPTVPRSGVPEMHPEFFCGILVSRVRDSLKKGRAEEQPQGLKPIRFQIVYGTTKVVP